MRTQGLPVQELDVQLDCGSKLVQQIKANVHAAHICKAYYTSQVWMKVQSPFLTLTMRPFRSVHLSPEAVHA